MKGEPFDLFAFTLAIAVDAVSHILLSGGMKESPQQASSSIQAFAATQGTLRVSDLLSMPSIPLDPFRHEVRRVNARAQRKLDALRPPRLTPDVVDTLCGSRLMTARQRRDNISTLLGAGSDTTGAAMGWAVLLAAGNETAATILSGKDPKAVNAVVKEVLRLFPPAPALSGLALNFCSISNVSIHAGTTIIISTWPIHRHRKLLQNPDDFRPARFLNQANAARFTFLLFGSGPGVCMGQGFAMLEMQIEFSALFRQYHFECVTGLPVNLKQTITLWPETPFLVRAMQT